MAMVGREAVQEQIRWDAKRKDMRELVAEKHVRLKYDLDPDLLECPICAEAFSPPVYQCENGHPACSACCRSITKGCPSCSQPLGRIRNIAIEKLIESVQVECRHAYHGCTAMVKYTQRANHENDLCQYRPIPCPVMRLFAGCNYTGPKASIPMHLTEKHGVRIAESSGSSASFRMRRSFSVQLTMYHLNKIKLEFVPTDFGHETVGFAEYYLLFDRQQLQWLCESRLDIVLSQPGSTSFVSAGWS